MDSASSLTLHRFIAIHVFLFLLGCAAVGLLYSAPANAQSGPACPYASRQQCDQGDAYAACYAAANAYITQNNLSASPNCFDDSSTLGDGVNVDYQKSVLCGINFTNGNYGGCPQTANGNHYKVGQTCLSRNAELGGVNNPIKWASSPGEQCIGGCRFEIVDQSQTKTITANAAGQTPTQTGTLYGGIWEYTGGTCNASPPTTRDDEKPSTTCSPAGSGQTYCVTNDGKNCHTTTSGRTICWAPGETGTKTDGAVTQTNFPGVVSPQPPEGSSHTNTTNVTTTNNTTNNSASITFNNYTTNNGAPAGTNNQGQGTDANGKPTGSGSGNGSGTGSPGSDGEGSGTGTASNDCQAAPTCSKGDAVECALLKQSWINACKLESDINASGSEGDHEGAANGFLGDKVGQGDIDSLFSTEQMPGVGDLNQSGFGGRGACPINFTFSAMGSSYTVDCEHLGMLLDALAALVLMAMAFHSGQILLGGWRR